MSATKYNPVESEAYSQAYDQFVQITGEAFDAVISAISREASDKEIERLHSEWESAWRAREIALRGCSRETDLLIESFS